MDSAKKSVDRTHVETKWQPPFLNLNISGIHVDQTANSGSSMTIEKNVAIGN